MTPREERSIGKPLSDPIPLKIRFLISPHENPASYQSLNPDSRSNGTLWVSRECQEIEGAETGVTIVP